MAFIWSVMKSGGSEWPHNLDLDIERHKKDVNLKRRIFYKVQNILELVQ